MRKKRRIQQKRRIDADSSRFTALTAILSATVMSKPLCERIRSGNTWPLTIPRRPPSRLRPNSLIRPHPQSVRGPLIRAIARWLSPGC